MVSLVLLSLHLFGGLKSVSCHVNLLTRNVLLACSADITIFKIMFKFIKKNLLNCMYTDHFRIIRIVSWTQKNRKRKRKSSSWPGVFLCLRTSSPSIFSGAFPPSCFTSQETDGVRERQRDRETERERESSYKAS